MNYEKLNIHMLSINPNWEWDFIPVRVLKDNMYHKLKVKLGAYSPLNCLGCHLNHVEQLSLW